MSLFQHFSILDLIIIAFFLDFQCVPKAAISNWGSYGSGKWSLKKIRVVSTTTQPKLQSFYMQHIPKEAGCQSQECVHCDFFDLSPYANNTMWRTGISYYRSKKNVLGRDFRKLMQSNWYLKTIETERQFGLVAPG